MKKSLQANNNEEDYAPVDQEPDYIANKQVRENWPSSSEVEQLNNLQGQEEVPRDVPLETSSSTIEGSSRVESERYKPSPFLSQILKQRSDVLSAKTVQTHNQLQTEQEESGDEETLHKYDLSPSYDDQGYSDLSPEGHKYGLGSVKQNSVSIDNETGSEHEFRNSSFIEEYKKICERQLEEEARLKCISVEQLKDEISMSEQSYMNISREHSTGSNISQEHSTGSNISREHSTGSPRIFNDENNFNSPRISDNDVYNNSPRRYPINDSLNNSPRILTSCEDFPTNNMLDNSPQNSYASIRERSPQRNLLAEQENFTQYTSVQQSTYEQSPERQLHPLVHQRPPLRQPVPPVHQHPFVQQHLQATDPSYSQYDPHTIIPGTSTAFLKSPFDIIAETLKAVQQNQKQNLSNHKDPVPLPESSNEIVPPAPDLQPVIDRLALYVAKNGEEFEFGIKDKQDPRFDFLNPWNMYHPYYLQQKKTNLITLEEQRKEGIIKFCYLS